MLLIDCRVYTLPIRLTKVRWARITLDVVALTQGRSCNRSNNIEVFCFVYTEGSVLRPGRSNMSKNVFGGISGFEPVTLQSHLFQKGIPSQLSYWELYPIPWSYTPTKWTLHPSNWATLILLRSHTNAKPISHCAIQTHTPPYWAIQYTPNTKIVSLRYDLRIQPVLRSYSPFSFTPAPRYFMFRSRIQLRQ